MELINIMCWKGQFGPISKQSVEEVINYALWDSMENIVDIPDDFD